MLDLPNTSRSFEPKRNWNDLMRITVACLVFISIGLSIGLFAQDGDSSPITQPESDGIESLAKQIVQLDEALRPSSEELRKLVTKWESEFRTGQWTVVRPARFESTAGASHAILDDGSILVSGKRGDVDSYRVELKTDPLRLAAIRIEALPDKSLPDGSSGRGDDGGFVVTEVQVRGGQRLRPTPRGRIVRVHQWGVRRQVSVDEVQVYSRGTNVARGGRASLSSLRIAGVSAKGGIDGKFSALGACTKTETDPWWEVDLGKEVPVDQIRVWGHPFDRDLRRSMNGVVVSLLDQARRRVWTETIKAFDKRTITLSTAGLAPVQLERATATVEDSPQEGSPYRTAAAQAAIDGDEHGKALGWSVGASGVAPQAISFEVRDEAAGHGSAIALDIHQQHGHGQLLGRFRISVSNMPLPALPGLVEVALKVDASDRSDADWKVLEDHLYHTRRSGDDLRPDAVWMQERLSNRINAELRAEDYAAALRWAREAVSLEQHRDGTAQSILGAAMAVALLSEATDQALAYRAVLRESAQRVMAEDDVDDWRRMLAEETLRQWDDLADNEAALKRLGRASRRYLTARAHRVSPGSDMSADTLALRAKYATEAAEIRRVLLGEQSYATGAACFEAGDAVRRQERFADAVPLLQGSLDPLGRIASSDVNAVDAHLGLATCHWQLNELDRAFASQQAAVKLLEQTNAEHDAATAMARTSLAQIAAYKGLYAFSIEQSQRAIETLKKHEATHRLKLARALLVQGHTLQGRGMSYEASQALDQAREIYSTTGQVESDEMIEVLVTLASAYSLLDEGFDARRDWEEALRIADKIRNDQRVAQVCTVLARYHIRLEETAIAESLLARAVKIQEDTGKATALAAFCYRSRAELLARNTTSKNDLLKAEKLLVKTLDIYRQTHPAEHPVFGICWSELGKVRAYLGRLEQARQDLERAIEITRQAIGTNNPNYLSQSLVHAQVLIQLDQYPQARESLTELLAMFPEHFDTRSAEFQVISSAYGTACFMLGETGEAVSHLRRGLTGRLRESEIRIRSMPEAQALAFHQGTLTMFEHCFAAMSSARDAYDAADAYQLAWTARGQVFRERARRRWLIQTDPALRGTHAQLMQVRQKLSDLYGNGDVAGWSAAWRKAVAELAREADKLEEIIAAQPHQIFEGRLLRELDGPLSKIDPKDLFRLPALNEKTAIVEFVRYGRTLQGGGKVTEVDYYDAFILRRDGEGFSTKWITLGQADNIDALIEGWRRTVAPRGLTRGYRRLKTTTKAPPEQQLRKQLWQPIESHLTGCSTVLLIPDSTLWRLPWAALPGRRAGQFLLENYHLATASHGVALYDLLSQDPPKNTGCLLVGGVDFGKPAIGPRANRRNWKTLSGSKREVQAISKSWHHNEHVQMVTGLAATEARVRQLMPKHRIVHIATHGVLADELLQEIQQPDAERMAFGGFNLGGKEGTVSGRHPMLLSWLVLGNANQPPATNAAGVPTGPDGLLTANELVFSDLSEVDLLVLSSCETGLGNIVGGEGVFGLQQAFHLAGARTVVASLWPIDDHAAEALMTRFHKNLASGTMGKLEALRDAQLAMLRGQLGKNRQRPEIETWAGWTLSGDWR